MKIFEVTLEAGVASNIPHQGRYFRMLTGTGEFSILFDNGVATDFIAGIGVSVPEFRWVMITSPTAQTVKIAVSELPIDDNRLAGEIALSGTLNTVATPRAITRTEFGAIAAEAGWEVILFGYEVDRAGVLIQNLSAGPIYYGVDLLDGPTTSANGLRIDAGGSFETKYNGMIVLRGSAAAQDVRYVAEYFV